MLITSADNKLIKRAASLSQKKYREEYGEFLAEGLRSVVDILKMYPQAVRYVFVDSEFVCDWHALSGVFSKVAGFEFLNEKVVEIPKSLMAKICDTKTPQQLAAIVTIKPQTGFDDFTQGGYIYLDRVRDPGNLGTIIRTAAGAGYSLILDNCADIYSPKVVRSSMSGIMSVDFFVLPQDDGGGSQRAFKDEFLHTLIKEDVFERIKTRGYTIIAADIGGENLYDIDMKSIADKQKICIVIGNEAEGIRKEIFEKCDKIVSIPIVNIESLNAAVSAAILMYHFKYLK